MISPAEPRKQAVRSRAEAKFAKAKQRDADIMGYQRSIRDAEAAKIVRLRALRIAKEAADKETSEQIAAEKAALAKQAKTSKPRQSRKPALD